MHASERQRVEEDLRTIEALLEKLPDQRPLERIGLEARHDELTEQLAKLAEDPSLRRDAAGGPTPRLAAADPDQDDATPVRGAA